MTIMKDWKQNRYFNRHHSQQQATCTCTMKHGITMCYRGDNCTRLNIWGFTEKVTEVCPGLSGATKQQMGRKWCCMVPPSLNGYLEVHHLIFPISYHDTLQNTFEETSNSNSDSNRWFSRAFPLALTCNFYVENEEKEKLGCPHLSNDKVRKSLVNWQKNEFPPFAACRQFFSNVERKSLVENKGAYQHQSRTWHSLNICHRVEHWAQWGLPY